MLRTISLVGLTLVVSGCDHGPELPSSRLASYVMPVSSDGMHMGTGGAVVHDHGVYIDPRCKTHEDDLWAMQIEEEKVLRDDARLEMINGRADGRYIPPLSVAIVNALAALGKVAPPRKILVRSDLAGWYLKDVRLHERCHAWLDETTGNYVFHR